MHYIYVVSNTITKHDVQHLRSQGPPSSSARNPSTEWVARGRDWGPYVSSVRVARTYLPLTGHENAGVKDFDYEFRR